MKKNSKGEGKMRNFGALLIVMLLALVGQVFAVTWLQPTTGFSTNSTTATFIFRANTTSAETFNNMTFFVSSSTGTNTTLATNTTAGTVFSIQSAINVADGNYTLYAQGGNVTNRSTIADIEIDTTSGGFAGGCLNGTVASNPVTVRCVSTETLTCKIADTNLAYAQMTLAFGTAATDHQYTAGVLGDGLRTYYVVCQDRNNNFNSVAFNVNFTMDLGSKVQKVTTVDGRTVVAGGDGLSGISTKTKVGLLFGLLMLGTVAAVAVSAGGSKKKRR